MKFLLVVLLLSCALPGQSTPVRQKRQYDEVPPVEQATLAPEVPAVIVTEAPIVPEVPAVVVTEAPIVPEVPAEVVTEIPVETVEEIQAETTPVSQVINEVQIATTLVPEVVQKVVPQIVEETVVHPEILTTQETVTATRIEPMTTIVVDTYERIVPQTTLVPKIIDVVPEVRTTIAPAPSERAELPAISVGLPATVAVPQETLDEIRARNKIRIQNIMAGYLAHLETIATQQASVQAQQEQIQAQLQQNLANAQKGIYTPISLPTYTPPIAVPQPIAVGQPIVVPQPTLPAFTLPPTYATIEEQIAANQAHVKALQDKALADVRRIQEENQQRLDAFNVQQRSYLSSLNIPNLAVAPPPAINPAAFGPAGPIVPTASDVEATTVVAPCTATESLITRLKRQNAEASQNLTLKLEEQKKKFEENAQNLRNMFTPVTVQPTVKLPASTTPMPLTLAPALTSTPAQPIALASTSPLPDFQAQFAAQQAQFKVNADKLAADIKVQQDKNKVEFEKNQAALNVQLLKIQEDIKAQMAKLAPSPAPTVIANPIVQTVAPLKV